MPIHPRCKSDMNQVYITAEGYVVPCCWMGGEPSMSEYRKLHAEYLGELSVRNRSLKEIMKDERYLKVEKSWASGTPFSTCAFACSKPLAQEPAGKQGSNQLSKFDLV